MKINHFNEFATIVVVSLLLLAFPQTCECESLDLNDKPLEIGDQAPVLRVTNCSLGKIPPLWQSESKKKVYVVDFFSLNSPGNTESLLFLSYLHEIYRGRGLAIISICRADEKIISEFLSGKLIHHTIANDVSGKDFKSYMASEITFPMVFVIDDKGEVLWKGDPRDLAGVLWKVFAGIFEPKKQKDLQEWRKTMREAMIRHKPAVLRECAQTILEIDPRDQLALKVRLMLFEADNNMLQALECIDKLLNEADDYPPLYLAKINVLRKNGSDPAKTREVAESMLKRFSKDSETMRELATTLFNSPVFRQIPLASAMNAAIKAVELLPKDAEPNRKSACLATLAKAYFLIGRLDMAIAKQKEALRIVTHKANIKQLQADLKFFEEAKVLHQKPR